MAKINIELGGKYSAAQAFNQASDDVKKVARETKDIGDAGKAAFNTVAQNVNGPLKSAMSTASSLIQSVGSGGLWGLIGAAASAAIGFVISKWQEAKQKMEDFVKYCNTEYVAAMQSLVEGFSGASKEIDRTTDKLIGLKDLKIGDIASQTATKVHDLHIQTLQKMTDDMSDAGKKALEAEEKVTVARLQYAAQAQQNQIAMQQKQALLDAAYDKQAEAEEALAAVNKQLESMKAANAEIIQKENSRKTTIQTIEDLYAKGLMDSETYERRKMNATAALTKFQEEHKDVLDKVAEAEKQRAKAEENLKKTEDDVVIAQNAKKAAVQQHSQKLSQLSSAVEDAKAAQLEANAALQEENRKRRQAAENAEVRMALEEEHQKEIDRVRKIALKNQLDEMEWREKYIKYIEDGCEVQEAYDNLQRELNEVLKDRKEKEEKAAEEAKKKGETGKDSASANMTVSLSNNAQDGIGEAVEEKQNFRQEQRKNRDEMKKARDAKNQMKIDQPKMVKAMKGEMPEAEAKEWIKYAKSKYTPDQMKELAKLGHQSQILSPKCKEYKEQEKRVQNMLKLMQDDGKTKTKREKAIEDTAKHTKETNESLKKLGAK